MKAPASPVYKFGEFRMDAVKRRLCRRDGSVVPLTPRVFETLLYLVEHHDTVLDKERLMEAVWPDSIVEENNLTQNISTLRRAFGEIPGSHRFIVTVPGRGYRFVADVQPSENTDGLKEPDNAADNGKAQVQLEPAPLASRPPSARQHNRWPVIIAVLTLLALGLGVSLLFQSRAFHSVQPPARLAPPPIAVRDKSIAVLPFENLSSDAENAYFAAGIQDDVLSSLAQIHELKVISRTSVMAYQKPSGRNMREIGQELGVANVLEGSVRRTGDRVLVSVQLIDARTDVHIWAERYDRTLADSIGLQGELAAKIAAALRARLAPAEKVSLATTSTSNPEAYDLYLQARGRERGGSKASDDDRATEQLYARAIALDPYFALAHARRSIIHSRLGQKAEARSEAAEALHLAPSLGDAHTALGLSLYWGNRDYDAALKEFSIALAISPNEPHLLTYIAGLYRRQGRWRESLATFQRAEVLDPRNGTVLFQAANSRIFVRDWSGARAGFERTSKVAPDFVQPRIGLAYIQVFQNNDVAAGRNILESMSQNVDPDGMLTEARWDLAMLDRDYVAAEKILTSFRVNKTFLGAAPMPYYYGCTALARGDAESAQRYFIAAAPSLEEQVRDAPNDPEKHAVLALLYAHMQRKEDALREGHLATALEPESQNAFHGPLWSSYLALVNALVGEQEEAINLIERLLSTPGPTGVPDFAEGMTLADLRLRWEWDSLRSNPRFQKILAGPEPETILPAAPSVTTTP